jgi:branched-chain amino acid transport system substrate-binding protein
MFMSINGVAVERLPPAGRRFVTAATRTQPGVEVEQFAVYGAQVAETLLDAIGRSDGTRASVMRELFRTNDAGGLIGPVAFDERGDIRQGAVTVVRMTGGDERPTSFSSLAGSVVERVIRVGPTAAATE